MRIFELEPADLKQSATPAWPSGASTLPEEICAVLMTLALAAQSF